MNAIEDLKKKTDGMSDEVVLTITTQQAKALLDQLEAERQRAAGSEEELHKALHREKAAERKLLAAQEEIAELKGKLANPVMHPTRSPGHSYASVAISARDEQWFTAINEAGFPVEAE